MLTSNYLQRLLSKWPFAIFIILIISAAIVVFSIQVNRWFPNYILSFCNTLEEELHAKIIFSSAYYKFPDHIVFKDMAIQGLNSQSPMLQAQKLTASFTLPLNHAPFHVVVIKNATIHWPLLKDHWEHYGPAIRAWASLLPHANTLHFILANGKLYLNDTNNPVSFSTDLRLNHPHIDATGSINNLHYQFKASTQHSRIEVEKFSLQTGNSSLNLWGNGDSHQINWNGYMIDHDIYILDIDGHLRMTPDAILLEKLSFSANGNAFETSGYCRQQNLYQCKADMIFNNVHLQLQTQHTKELGVSLKGMADIHLGTNSSYGVQEIHLNFEGLRTSLINNNFLKFEMPTMQSTFSLQQGQYTVPFNNVLASMDFSNSHQNTVDLSASMFGGHFFSRVFLDTDQTPWSIKVRSNIDKLDLQRLSVMLPSLHEAQGLLSGTVETDSSRNLNLTGNAHIDSGSFNDVDFQSWLAQSLHMPSLDHLTDAQLSVGFTMQGKTIMLDDLNLNTRDLNLDGFFHLDSDDLVSSRMAVRFSKALMKESNIGRHIMGMVRGAWDLPFEFQLSGNVHRMNFEWNNSVLKNKVRQHIFYYIARLIDRHLEAHPDYKVTMPNESVSPG